VFVRTLVVAPWEIRATLLIEAFIADNCRSAAPYPQPACTMNLQQDERLSKFQQRINDPAAIADVADQGKLLEAPPWEYRKRKKVQ
jgi:hypothetical protein